LQTAAGTYAVVATNNSTGCTNNMSGSATIVVNALPASYSVTGGGSYCSGGAGVRVYLSGSQFGVNYQLYNGASTAGSAIGGTSVALDFGALTTAGTYTVAATNAITGCTANMSSSASITVNSLPVAYTLTGGGSYCEGGTGSVVGLTNSQSGVSYQLYSGATALSAAGSAVSGTGSAISFAPQTMADVYTAIGTNAATGCTNTMSGSETISMNAAPAIVSVTGGGSYVPGGSGVHIGLTGSCTGINYQLYSGATAVGSPVAGVGYSLDFGSFTSAGTYTVIAINATTSCTSAMSDSAIVSIESSGQKQAEEDNTASEVKTVSAINILVTPNPNKGTFTVKGNLSNSSEDIVYLEVVDMTGKIIYQNNVSIQNGTIDQQVQLSNTFANGMYLLNVHSKTENKVFHIVVEK
jgi:hypothetical protein